MHEDNCLFCKIAQGKISSKKIYENDNFFSILDQNQDIMGHTLVISKNHFITILDIPQTMGVELLDCIKKTYLNLVDRIKAEGFNILNNNFEAAGQVIKHVHFHILPRKKGDNVRVIG